MDDTESLPSSTINRHFSSLDLPSNILCYSSSEKKCPTTEGLDNIHTELLALLISDHIFRDFFNVFLLLPIHSHQCTIKQSNEDSYFEVFPLVRGSGHRLGIDRMLQWLYSNRLPFFLTSRLYQLCIFTHFFCENNYYMNFDGDVEYTKKELVMFSDLRTVEGIQKLIRHAGSASDGVMIQLWLDLQCLRHTDKELGHNDMMKSILMRYSAESSKLPTYFKNGLLHAISDVGQISLNSQLLKRKENLSNSYDILSHTPFLTKRGNTDSQKHAEKDPLTILQNGLMNSLKSDFCRRYLSYYDCLPAKFHYTSPDIALSDLFSSRPDSAVDDKAGPLDAGRSKSTLPSMNKDSHNKILSGESKQRPKTCNPHLQPRIRAMSRISIKTSGYISLTAEDRLAVYSRMSSDIETGLKKCPSEPNLLAHEQLYCEKEKLCKYSSMISLYDSTNIEVNEDAIEKCRRSISNYKERIDSRNERIDSRASNLSTSIDLQSSVDNVNIDNNKTPSSQIGTDVDITTMQKGYSGTSGPVHKRHDATHLLPGRYKSLLPSDRDTNALTPEIKMSDLLDDGDEGQKQILIGKDLSMSIQRKNRYQDIMHTRRASSFMRRSPCLKALCSNVTDEAKKALEEIVSNRSPEVIYAQDKTRLYVAIIASDQLAGGPFKNYLNCKHDEVGLEYLTLWENVEVLRCLTTEGGRRGATTKNFGGNGFLSCHDEWPVLKDDPYHQYHESLRQIKKYPDSWNDFCEKLNYTKDFLMQNDIKKPYDTDVLQQYVDQLETAGCNDEILALMQDHMMTKLKKEIDHYYKFDSKNFFYYLSSHDDQFQFPRQPFRNPADKFLGQTARLDYRPLNNYHTSTDLFRELIFSPLSSRLWIAVDICERLTFPFALRKLSMPLLTLGSMIKMKMFLMRRRKEKERKEMLLSQGKDPTKENNSPSKKKATVSYKNRIKKPRSPKAKRLKDKPLMYVQEFHIPWDDMIAEYTENVNTTKKNLIESTTRDFLSLAPPSIDDMLLQDPTLKNLRRFIVKQHKGPVKDQLMNVINFLVAQNDIQEKIDTGDVGELCKAVCSVYIFGKNSILPDVNLPQDKLQFINKKRACQPTFVLLLGALIKNWIYENIWSNFISKMYPNGIAYEEFYNAKKLRYWKPPIFKKILCKRLMHFSMKISNFLSFLSVPTQFEEFRDFLTSQRKIGDKEKGPVDKVMYGKGTHPIMIHLNRLVQDLYLLTEIFSYKNLVLTSREVAMDMSFSGYEDFVVAEKAQIIVSTFLDSVIPPRLQVNLPSPVAADALFSVRHQHTPYKMFNEITSHLLQSLLIFWKKFCISKHCPRSKKKEKMIRKLSGTSLHSPTATNTRLKSIPLILYNSPSKTEKMCLSKDLEIGGYSFSMTKGCREIFREKHDLQSSYSSMRASKSIQSLADGSRCSSRTSVKGCRSPYPGRKTTATAEIKHNKLSIGGAHRSSRTSRVPVPQLMTLPVLHEVSLQKANVHAISFL